METLNNEYYGNAVHTSSVHNLIYDQYNDLHSKSKESSGTQLETGNSTMNSFRSNNTNSKKPAVMSGGDNSSSAVYGFSNPPETSYGY